MLSSNRLRALNLLPILTLNMSAIPRSCNLSALNFQRILFIRVDVLTDVCLMHVVF